jgi:hypothetical protein
MISAVPFEANIYVHTRNVFACARTYSISIVRNSEVTAKFLNIFMLNSVYVYKLMCYNYVRNVRREPDRV